MASRLWQGFYAKDLGGPKKGPYLKTIAEFAPLEAQIFWRNGRGFFRNPGEEAACANTRERSSDVITQPLAVSTGARDWRVSRLLHEPAQGEPGNQRAKKSVVSNRQDFHREGQTVSAAVSPPAKPAQIRYVPTRRYGLCDGFPQATGQQSGQTKRSRRPHTVFEKAETGIFRAARQTRARRVRRKSCSPLSPTFAPQGSLQQNNTTSRRKPSPRCVTIVGRGFPCGQKSVFL